MKKPIIEFIYTCAYAGRSPVMPGTVGTLWGLPVWWAVSGLPLYLRAMILAAVLVIALYSAGEAVKASGDEDPQSVVIDEVVGLLVASVFIPFTPVNAIMVFILFRFFDILKPYPVKVVENRLKGGAGVVLDDCAAGVYAGVLAHLLIWLAL